MLIQENMPVIVNPEFIFLSKALSVKGTAIALRTVRRLPYDITPFSPNSRIFYWKILRLHEANEKISPLPTVWFGVMLQLDTIARRSHCERKYCLIILLPAIDYLMSYALY